MYIFLPTPKNGVGKKGDIRFLYSQNELNSGFSTIQLVIILGYLIYRTTFTLFLFFTVLFGHLVDIFP